MSADLPVRVTWDQAESLCSSAGGRLLTEAEWEYAARAGSASGIGNPNFEEPNAFGLYVRRTSVREWTGDWFENYSPGPSVDPTGPPSGQKRAVRSTHFGKYTEDHRLSYRYGAEPDDRFKNGFRCVFLAPSTAAPSLVPAS